MKILSPEKIKELDRLTCEKQGISSLELMERASRACVKRIVKLVSNDKRIYVFCGKGNNGGDGLAITRMLLDEGWQATAVVVHFQSQFSEDADNNYRQLQQRQPSSIVEIHKAEELNSLALNSADIIIDALLGTGTTRPADGLLADVIEHVNKSGAKVISIDVPSGLRCSEITPPSEAVVRANLCLTFHAPKLAFLLPQNQQYVPEFELVDIGLDENLAGAENYFYITQNDIIGFLRKRNKFSHKGNFGHALLLAGSKGKSGAALISAQACLRSGAGLLTVHSTKDVLASLSAFLPEAMGFEDAHSEVITEIEPPEKFNAIGFGPGIGTHEDTQLVLKKLLNYYGGKLVIDADGLNILSENKTWLSFLPASTVLTPHPKEFERLTEKTNNDFERLELLKKFSMRHNCIVVLKGAHSAIAMPDGNIFFNSTGNPGLAKGGSGDALTGIILGLMARGYNAPQASLIGTFVHGLAADISLKKRSIESLLISDVISALPKAFLKLEKKS